MAYKPSTSPLDPGFSGTNAGDEWTGVAKAPKVGSLASFIAWWGQNSTQLGNEWTAYREKNYLDPMNTWRTKLPADTWAGTQYETDYNSKKGSLADILARIQGGPQSADTQAAMDQAALMYGYTPSAWAAMQANLPNSMNASNVMTNAAGIAGNIQNTAFGQDQAKAMRVAQQQATEAVGKQLEAVFGERGGLGGFQAAYDLTGQLSSQIMQQQSQNSIAMFDRAVSAINAENGYYKELIDKGAIAGQQYLTFRWDALQTSYQDTMTSMNQDISSWQNITEEDRRIINGQIDALTQQMTADMGNYSDVNAYLAALYALWAQPYLDAQAEADYQQAHSGGLFGNGGFLGTGL